MEDSRSSSITGKYFELEMTKKIDQNLTRLEMQFLQQEYEKLNLNNADDSYS